MGGTERRNIVELWRRGSAALLASLVRVQGSSYRRPGAQLLLASDGSWQGSISAGCLEGDLLRKAAWLTRHGAAVVTYSTLFDNTSEMPFGLGCGGVLDVLLEPVATPECEALLLALERSLAGEEQWVYTLLPEAGRPLARAIFGAGGELLFASKGLHADLLSRVRADEVENTHCEHLTPPQRLFVLGAGDDAQPLVKFASLLGWSVVVADGRSQLARPERFPSPGVEVSCSPTSAMAHMREADAAVLMTHSFEQDRALLPELLKVAPRYLGLLGSRQRSALLLAQAAEATGLPLSECCRRVHAPAGLDLGGDGPEAVALAILAEAQACLTASGAARRQLTPERVWSYLAKNNDQAAASPAQCALDAG